MTNYLSDAWLVDDAGIYSHYDTHGHCDEIEIPDSHFHLQRCGDQWCVTVTTGSADTPTGVVTFRCDMEHQ